MFTYLQEKKYYEDLYDKLTVESCRASEKLHEQRMQECKNEDEAKAAVFVHKLYMWSKTGEEYSRRRETIEKWMERDKKRDEILEKTTPPKDILCRDCGIYMELESKHLHSDSGRNKEKVLFMMRCNECRNGRGIFDDGSEFKCKPQLCPVCRSELHREHGETEDKYTTEYTCKNCAYGRCEWLDMHDEDEQPSEEEVRRFRIDKDKYCLSDKDGMEYIAQQHRIKELGEIMNKMKGREENFKSYKAAKELKKLSVKAVEKKLATALRKSKYEKLKLREPDVGKDVVVEFKIQDANEEREAYDSRQSLKKTIAKALKDTNWKLMSEGVDYRLGVLSGRLRGYESEEDLVKLVELRQKK